ncbi:MAG: DUF4365 domain-containing protein, partial [Saprospiraceae bacterium]
MGRSGVFKIKVFSVSLALQTKNKMRKLRTRQHVIEDLSYNFVEKQVLLAFCTFERYTMRQYSYDGHVFTFDEKGQTEGGFFFVQVKATDHLTFSKKNQGYELALEKRDLELWLGEKQPVLIVLYDAPNDKGYYIGLEEYFRENRILLRDA